MSYAAFNASQNAAPVVHVNNSQQAIVEEYPDKIVHRFPDGRVFVIDRFEFKGSITYILKDDNVPNTIFRAMSASTRSEYIFRINEKIPLEVNDCVIGICQPNISKGTDPRAPDFIFEGIPNICVPYQKNSILEFFMRVGRIGYEKAEAFYSLLEREYAITIKNYNEIAINDIKVSKEFSPLPGKEIYDYLCKLGDDYYRFGILPDAKDIEIDETIVRRIIGVWISNYSIRQLKLLGLTQDEIVSARCFTSMLYAKLLRNPYTVCSISMEKALHIAQILKLESNVTVSVCGKILRFVFTQYSRNAWMCVPYWMLQRNFALIFYNNSIIESYRKMLQDEYELVFDDELQMVYMLPDYLAEYRLTNFFVDTMKFEETSKKFTPKFDEDNDTKDLAVDNQIVIPTPATKIALVEEQKTAITGALNSTCIINGGPGVGKSTVCKEILRNLDMMGKSYVTASFTGKAVSRFSEVTGCTETKTLHLLIAKANRGLDTNDHFTYLILDESSMINCELFMNFLLAYGIIDLQGNTLRNIRVIFVGDENQLTPISAGSLFASIINSSRFPRFTLQQNHRVKNINDDGILLNMKAIRLFDREETPDGISLQRRSNFILIDTHGDQNGDPRAREIISNIVQSFHAPDGERPHHFDLKDFVLLCPYRKPTIELAEMISFIYTGRNPEFTDTFKRKWRLGDKVMIKQNYYPLNLYNGDEGFIININSESVSISFGKKGTHTFALRWTGYSTNVEVTDEQASNEAKQDMRLIVLATAFTVHTSQGSEWKAVIVYVPYGYKASGFLCSNLMYTALSRAKEIVFLVGNVALANYACSSSPTYRYETLSLRLAKALPKHLALTYDELLLKDYSAAEIEDAASLYFDDFDF